MVRERIARDGPSMHPVPSTASFGFSPWWRGWAREQQAGRHPLQSLQQSLQHGGLWLLHYDRSSTIHYVFKCVNFLQKLGP